MQEPPGCSSTPRDTQTKQPCLQCTMHLWQDLMSDGNARAYEKGGERQACDAQSHCTRAT